MPVGRTWLFVTPLLTMATRSVGAVPVLSSLQAVLLDPKKVGAQPLVCVGVGHSTPQPGTKQARPVCWLCELTQPLLLHFTKLGLQTLAGSPCAQAATGHGEVVPSIAAMASRDSRMRRSRVA